MNARAHSLAGQRIAVYARFSTDKQNALSLDDQLRVCADYATRHGGDVSPELVFLDAGISGTSTARPGLEQLQAAAQAGKIDVVITEDLSRIGRSVGNNDRVLKDFKQWGARLLALNDGIDTGQRSSKLLTVIKSAMAEEYIDELKERTRRGMDGLFQAGMHTGGRVYGYDSATADDGTDRKRLVINKAQAEVVRRIFDRYSSGKSYRAIAQELNHAALPSPRGGKWSQGTVRIILRNELYAGEVVYNRKRWTRSEVTGKRTYETRPRAEWKRASMPELRIVDAITWSDVQGIQRGSATTYSTKARRGYPLSGLVRCGRCGALMTMAGGGRYYRCSGHSKGHGDCDNGKHLRERAVRCLVFDQVRDRMGSDNAIRSMRDEWAKTVGTFHAEIRAELKERRTALTRAEQHISKLLEMQLDGNDSPSVQAKLREKEDHAELQRAAVTRLEAELDVVPALPSPDQIRDFLRSFHDAALLAPDEARHELSRLLIDGRIDCVPPEKSSGDYRVEFKIDSTCLPGQTSRPPSGGRTFVMVAGAGYQLKRVWAVVEGLCPQRYER